MITHLYQYWLPRLSLIGFFLASVLLTPSQGHATPLPAGISDQLIVNALGSSTTNVFAGSISEGVGEGTVTNPMVLEFTLSIEETPVSLIPEYLLYEPGTLSSPSPVLSDVLQLQFGPSTPCGIYSCADSLTVSLYSDPSLPYPSNINPCPHFGFSCMEESPDGNSFDFPSILIPSSFSPVGALQIVVQSDVDTVPEPSSLILLASGLAGLGALGRKVLRSI